MQPQACMQTWGMRVRQRERTLPHATRAKPRKKQRIAIHIWLQVLGKLYAGLCESTWWPPRGCTVGPAQWDVHASNYDTVAHTSARPRC